MEYVKNINPLLPGIQSGIHAELNGRLNEYRWLLGEAAYGRDDSVRPSRLIFGPTYHIQTSKGEQLDIITVIFDHETAIDDPNLWNHLTPYRDVYMLTCSRQGYPAAFQRLHLTYYGDTYVQRYRKHFHRDPSKADPRATAEVEVVTGVRGAGLAKPLQAVALDFFQREANRIGYRIERRIINTNQAYYHPDQVEIKRWHALFGHRGWLAQDPRYIPKETYHEEWSYRETEPPVVAWMRFQPDGATEGQWDELEEIAVSVTRRQPGERGKLIKVTGEKPRGDDTAHQVRQRHRLQFVLGRWKEIGAPIDLQWASGE